MLLNEQWVTEEVKRENKIFLEIKGTYQNLWDIA
jgi:hypothetical protein